MGPTTPPLAASPRLSTTPCWPRLASTTTPATTMSLALHVESTSGSAPSPSPPWGQRHHQDNAWSPARRSPSIRCEMPTFHSVRHHQRVDLECHLDGFSE